MQLEKILDDNKGLLLLDDNCLNHIHSEDRFLVTLTKIEETEEILGIDFVSNVKFH